MTRTPLSRSKGGQGHQATLLTAVLARQAAAAVAWERVGRGKLLLRCVCSAAQGDLAPTEEKEGRGISWWPPAYSLFTYTP